MKHKAIKTESKMKKCPFCGGSARLLTARGKGGYVVCNKCLTESAWRAVAADAISAWNMRGGK